MKNLILVFALICFYYNMLAQDDIPIDNGISDSENKIVEKVFPTIQVFNFPTTTVLKKGEMKL